jgi:hypothetical protein
MRSAACATLALLAIGCGGDAYTQDPRCHVAIDGTPHAGTYGACNLTTKLPIGNDPGGTQMGFTHLPGCKDCYLIVHFVDDPTSCGADFYDSEWPIASGGPPAFASDCAITTTVFDLDGGHWSGHAFMHVNIFDTTFPPTVIAQVSAHLMGSF